MLFLLLICLIFSSDDSSWKAHRNAKALKQEYNLIISFECILHILLVRAIVYAVLCVVPFFEMDDDEVWIITCASHCSVFKTPLIIAIIMKITLLVCRFDYFYRVATESLVELPPLNAWSRNVYELQLNQIIRHHDEWIISPGHLLCTLKHCVTPVCLHNISEKMLPTYQMHRIVWVEMCNRWPAQEIKNNKTEIFIYKWILRQMRSKCVLWWIRSFWCATVFVGNSHYGTPILFVFVFIHLCGILLLSVHQLASSFEWSRPLFFEKSKYHSFWLQALDHIHLRLSVFFFSIHCTHFN